MVCQIHILAWICPLSFKLTYLNACLKCPFGGWFLATNPHPGNLAPYQQVVSPSTVFWFKPKLYLTWFFCLFVCLHLIFSPSISLVYSTSKIYPESSHLSTFYNCNSSVFQLSLGPLQLIPNVSSFTLTPLQTFFHEQSCQRNLVLKHKSYITLLPRTYCDFPLHLIQASHYDVFT